MVRVELVGVRLPARHGSRAALDLAPRLTFERGTCSAVFGQRGAGKTALLDVVAGLRAPAAGQILFDDCDVTAMSPAQRNVAYVLATPAVYETLAVRDNLMLPLRRRGLDRQAVEHRVDEVSEALSLRDVLGARAGTLTRAQQHRVALGRAFVRSDAAAILLDDPFGPIAPPEHRSLGDGLRALIASVRATLVLATPQLDEALTQGDRLVVLERGQAVQAGAPPAVFDRPVTTRVAALLCDPPMNLLPCTVAGNTIAAGPARLEHGGGSLAPLAGRRLELGVRPDELRLVSSARKSSLVGQLESVQRQPLGKLATFRAGDTAFCVVCAADQQLVAGYRYHVDIPASARLYADGVLVDA